MVSLGVREIMANHSGSFVIWIVFYVFITITFELAHKIMDFITIFSCIFHYTF